MKSQIRLVSLLSLASMLIGCAKSEAPAEVEAAAPQPGSSPAAGLTGRLVFSAEGDIYVMNVDGSGREMLTSDPAEDFDPAWSPDGTRIAFRSHRDGNEEVYLMRADGSDQRNISNSPGTDYSPAWSPDGEWIAFNSDRAGNGSIWVMRPDGTNSRQVTDIDGVSEYPSWSPDGERIAFHCTFGRVLPNGTGDFEICVVDADGSRLSQLTDSAGESKLPAWSPDGLRIAFQTNRNGWPSLPDVQPQGYDSDRFGDYEIYLMNADGSGKANVTNNPMEDEEFPAWSRDGHLIFSRYGCLVAMNVDGSGPSPVGSCAEGGQFPDWYQPAP